ncbi:hypothetical protein EVAR_79663_1 [Eumeta japonica]|uniref:Uncharacterized protein n=1 Tax=Eumeta variegata TaxID=151549 RepID=A0A4C1WCD3_EUMVA|nr:hypothetical protein EVAR_79663_1 [Eumeta japonica]
MCLKYDNLLLRSLRSTNEILKCALLTSEKGAGRASPTKFVGIPMEVFLKQNFTWAPVPLPWPPAPAPARPRHDMSRRNLGFLVPPNIFFSLHLQESFGDVVNSNAIDFAGVQVPATSFGQLGRGVLTHFAAGIAGCRHRNASAAFTQNSTDER